MKWFLENLEQLIVENFFNLFAVSTIYFCIFAKNRQNNFHLILLIYAKVFFGKKAVNVEFYIETKEKGKMQKISYNGNVEGLKELKNLIKTLK